MATRWRASQRRRRRSFRLLLRPGATLTAHRIIVALALLLAGGAFVTWIGRPEEPSPRAPRQASQEDAPKRAAPVPRAPRFEPYEPAADEPYINAKRTAGRAAQRLATYQPGQTAQEVAAGVAERPDMGSLRSAAARLLRPATASGAEVVYPQLSGVTETTAGVMVVVRQVLVTADRPPETVTRTVDVRLRRGTGAWSIASIPSVGGAQAPRPAELSEAARRVLDHPRIRLSDSARWDIHRDEVDDRLLTALAAAAERRRIAVAVLRSGHPRNVWATERRSAHADGLAADIYAVGGRPVLEQRERDSPAYRLAEELIGGGATQVGSPWAFATPSAFTDAVHQDHLHVQQAPGSAVR